MSDSSSAPSTPAQRQRLGRRSKSKPQNYRSGAKNTPKKPLSPWVYLVRLGICLVGMSTILGTTITVIKMSQTNTSDSLNTNYIK